ncbi:F-box only protein 7 [Lampris incognitus]|uniref:F-box only protein 7 n=1 Tax=Lampris incognitus TaxID=2546036 RepID=UPI0024B51F43|nr:F-box only protein 7 [Lampris incognitus]XP_056132953.1 F-box only protein 7 [Lampris incognitus]
MKLRVRVYNQTIRVELQGEQPTLTELRDHIKEIVLPSHGLSPDTDFTLSLNGIEPLSNDEQPLSTFGVVSGDLICMILPQSSTVSPASVSPPHQATKCSSGSGAACLWEQPNSTRHTPPTLSNEAGTSSLMAARYTEDKEEESREEDTGARPYISEPMLCSEAEEGRVPLSLDVLHHSAQSRGPSDSLMVAMHLVMLETGFIPQGTEIKPGEMPSGWRAAGGVYKLQYTHPLCDSSLIMVVAVSMGPMLVINATLKLNETVDKMHKLSLDPCSYITEEWAGDSAATVFKDLSKLSRTFKDQLAYPLITAAREAMALPAAFGLCALPPELLLRVLRLLDVRSLVTLSSVNKQFYSATEDSSLWRHMYHRDFRDQDPTRPRETDWKELYKRKYKLRNDYRHTAHRYLAPFIFPDPPNILIPDPFPLYPPGIIGGEYDQRPNIPHGILPRPRYDPIGPLPGQNPLGRGVFGRHGLRPAGSRPADIRRGFI